MFSLYNVACFIYKILIYVLMYFGVSWGVCWPYLLFQYADYHSASEGVCPFDRSKNFLGIERASYYPLDLFFIVLSVLTQQFFKVCLMAILGFLFDCMHKRTIL